MKITGDEISKDIGQTFTSFERQRHFQNIIITFRYGDMVYYWGLKNVNLTEKLPMICVYSVTQENTVLQYDKNNFKQIKEKTEDIKKIHYGII